MNDEERFEHFRDVATTELYPWQKRLLDQAENHPEKVDEAKAMLVAACKAPGKTGLVGEVAVALAGGSSGKIDPPSFEGPTGLWWAPDEPSQIDKISRMPDVSAHAGVGDGSVADAVTALIGRAEVAERERDEAIDSTNENATGWAEALTKIVYLENACEEHNKQFAQAAEQYEMAMAKIAEARAEITRLRTTWNPPPDDEPRGEATS